MLSQPHSTHFHELLDRLFAADRVLLPPAGEKGALAHKELPPAEPIAGADESVAVYELVREAAK